MDDGAVYKQVVVQIKAEVDSSFEKAFSRIGSTADNAAKGVEAAFTRSIANLETAIKRLEAMTSKVGVGAGVGGGGAGGPVGGAPIGGGPIGPGFGGATAMGFGGGAVPFSPAVSAVLNHPMMQAGAAAASQSGMGAAFGAYQSQLAAAISQAQTSQNIARFHNGGSPWPTGMLPPAHFANLAAQFPEEFFQNPRNSLPTISGRGAYQAPNYASVFGAYQPNIGPMGGPAAAAASRFRLPAGVGSSAAAGALGLFAGDYSSAARGFGSAAGAAIGATAGFFLGGGAIGAGVGGSAGAALGGGISGWAADNYDAMAYDSAHFGANGPIIDNPISRAAAIGGGAIGRAFANQLGAGESSRMVQRGLGERTFRQRQLANAEIDKATNESIADYRGGMEYQRNMLASDGTLKGNLAAVQKSLGSAGNDEDRLSLRKQELEIQRQITAEAVRTTQTSIQGLEREKDSLNEALELRKRQTSSAEAAFGYASKGDQQAAQRATEKFSQGRGSSVTKREREAYEQIVLPLGGQQGRKWYEETGRARGGGILENIRGLLGLQKEADEDAGQRKSVRDQLTQERQDLENLRNKQKELEGKLQPAINGLIDALIEAFDKKANELRAENKGKNNDAQASAAGRSRRGLGIA